MMIKRKIVSKSMEIVVMTGGDRSVTRDPKSNQVNYPKSSLNYQSLAVFTLTALSFKVTNISAMQWPMQGHRVFL